MWQDTLTGKDKPQQSQRYRWKYTGQVKWHQHYCDEWTRVGNVSPCREVAGNYSGERLQIQTYFRTGKGLHVEHRKKSGRGAPCLCPLVLFGELKTQRASEGKRTKALQLFTQNEYCSMTKRGKDYA